MPTKIDPLNKKLYCSVTTMLTVTDVKAAAAFYQKAFGFAKRGIMNGPDGKAIHAELTLRGTTLMLGPEVPQMGSRSVKTIGASPASLYLLTENADKVVEKAVKLGAAPKGPVMEMFWGDRCGTVVDAEGYTWMVATHIGEPTPREMKKKMKEQMASQPVEAPSGSEWVSFKVRQFLIPSSPSPARRARQGFRDDSTRPPPIWSSDDQIGHYYTLAPLRNTLRFLAARCRHHKIIQGSWRDLTYGA